MFISLPLKRKSTPGGKNRPANAARQPVSIALDNGSQRYILSGGLTASITRQPLRLPAGYSHIRIVSGNAYVSYDREDYFLRCGSELALGKNSSDAVISSMGPNTLIFDIIR